MREITLGRRAVVLVVALALVVVAAQANANSRTLTQAFVGTSDKPTCAPVVSGPGGEDLRLGAVGGACFFVSSGAQHRILLTDSLGSGSPGYVAHYRAYRRVFTNDGSPIDLVFEQGSFCDSTTFDLSLGTFYLEVAVGSSKATGACGANELSSIAGIVTLTSS